MMEAPKPTHPWNDPDGDGHNWTEAEQAIEGRVRKQ